MYLVEQAENMKHTNCFLVIIEDDFVRKWMKGIDREKIKTKGKTYLETFSIKEAKVFQ